MSANLCEQCTAVCCRYIALPIETPKTAADFDDVRWYLIHENVAVFVEDGEWYVLFHTPCRHIQPDHHCAIYLTRPRICRNYSHASCDYHSGDYGWEHHFTGPEQLDQFLSENPPAARKARAKSRATTIRQPHTRPRQRPANTDRHGVPLPTLPPP